jgi:hypothetical protein
MRGGRRGGSYCGIHKRGLQGLTHGKVKTGEEEEEEEEKSNGSSKSRAK